MVAYNANKEDVQVKLPKSDKWQVCVNGEKAGTDVIETINGDTVTVKAQSTMVLVLGDTKGNPDNSNPEDTSKVTPTPSDNDNSNGVNTGRHKHTNRLVCNRRCSTSCNRRRSIPHSKEEG